jgi:catechol 2,3-dioxygenase-like lactoylglutathione lyase family enzyme
MIDHTGVNVSDLARSRAFYELALAPLGYRVCLEIGNTVGFGERRDEAVEQRADFWIGEGEPQTPRVHVAFRAKDRRRVDEFHAAALAAGGTDNGPPGLRPHYHEGYYAAYALDPDGYNIEAVCREG